LRFVSAGEVVGHHRIGFGVMLPAQHDSEAAVALRHHLVGETGVGDIVHGIHTTVRGP
jgi:hypothetical protein